MEQCVCVFPVLVVASCLSLLFSSHFKLLIKSSIGKLIVYWKRLVNYKKEYINPIKIKYVIEKLNGHHRNIQFPHVFEENQIILFVDILITRRGNNKVEAATVFKNLPIQNCVSTGSLVIHKIPKTHKNEGMI